MLKTPCRDKYRAEQAARAAVPLKHGEYKLREAYIGIRRCYEALGLVESGVEDGIPILPHYDLKGWTGADWRDELAKIALNLSSTLGYEALPAINTMGRSPTAPTVTRDYLHTVSRQIDALVGLCDELHPQISTPSKRKDATLKRIGLADMLVVKALMIIEDVFAVAGLPQPECG